MLGPSWKSIRKKIERDFGGVPTIGTSELAALLEGQGGRVPILLDVRAAAEFNVSHLPNAIRVSDLDHAKQVIEDQMYSGPVVAYCSVGYRSAELVRSLMEDGLTEVFNLDGSLFQWANEGRPLFQGTTPVSVAHPFDRKWGKLLDRHLHAEQDG